MGSGTLNRIPAGSRIALDTVSFVYFLERHPTFYRPAKDLFERIEKGKIATHGIGAQTVATGPLPTIM